MFVEIVDQVITTPSGEVIRDISMGLLLEVEGEEQGIPVRELRDIYLDSEDLEQAKKLYVTYKGQEYEFEVPGRDTVDWEYLTELIEPE